MGEVRLPVFVRRVCFGAMPGVAGVFVGLWGDRSGAGEDPPDGGAARLLIGRQGTWDTGLGVEALNAFVFTWMTSFSYRRSKVRIHRVLAWK